MKYIILIATITFTYFVGCKQQMKESTTRKEICINKDWEFQIGDKINESNWKQIHIPHIPKIEPLVVNNQWQGVCWYKKIIPHHMIGSGEKHFLKFEGIMQEAEVWVNQEYITKHRGGYFPFTVDISNYINRDENNIVFVKVTNKDNPAIPPGKPLKNLDFNLYGGIYRNVHFISSNNVYISNAVAGNKVNGGGVLIHFDEISESKASGMAKVHVVNDSKTDQLVGVDIILSHSSNQLTFSSPPQLIKINRDTSILVNFSVNNPYLWSPETPNIYEVGVTLTNNDGQIQDSVSFTTGIRKIELNSQGFFLNGKKRFLNGTNRHQEYPYIGYAIPDNAHYRDAYKIKQAGFDFVRLSHYPHSESFLNACDELGLMVMNCIPGWQFFEEGSFVQNSFQDIRDLIRRDRNHPSIMFWENSLNESAMTEDYMVKANAIVKDELPYYDTYTAGWIDHPSYDLYIPARQHGSPPHYWNNYGNGGKQVLIAEYGDWEYYAQNAGFNQKEFNNLMHEERSSRQQRRDGERRLLQQALNYQESFNSNLKGKNMIGHANWLMFDYNRGYADDIESSGISDIFRIPKFAHFFYKSQKSPNQDEESKPMVYIASHWTEKSEPNIKVYSNCEEVALYLNDTLVERKKVNANILSSHLRHPPFNFTVTKFRKGQLKAIAYLNDKEVSQHIVTSHEIPYKIKLTLDISEKPVVANSDDIIFVYAHVLDVNNDLVVDAQNEITFSIKNSQEAEIIGPLKIKAEAGIATTLVRTNYTSKKIQLLSESNNILSDTLNVLF